MQAHIGNPAKPSTADGATASSSRSSTQRQPRPVTARGWTGAGYHAAAEPDTVEDGVRVDHDHPVEQPHTSVPVARIEAPPRPCAATIGAELRVLRKSWGAQPGQRPERVGPTLRQLFGITEHDSPIDRVADWIRDTVSRLPQDLRISALGAFGLHPPAQRQFLTDRVTWVAEQLDRDPRTARRRINTAIDALADLAVQPAPTTVDLRGLIGRLIELTCTPCGTDDDHITRQGHLVALAQAIDHPDRCLAIVEVPDQQPRTIAIPTTRILRAASLDQTSPQPANDRPTEPTRPRTEENTVTELSPQPEGTRRR